MSKDKVAVFIHGGIGNQLFQIAACKEYAKKYNKEEVYKNAKNLWNYHGLERKTAWNTLFSNRLNVIEIEDYEKIEFEQIDEKRLNMYDEIEYKEKYLNVAWFDERGYDKDIPTSYEELELRTSNGNSNHTIADLVVFETNKNVVDDWQMNIHQDTTFWWGEFPSHMFNFNIYVNDDYEGGEITFFDSKKAEKVEYKDSYSGKPAIAWVVDDYSTYKMQAGDGLIFPVDVYHGVLPIKNGGEKYYVRQFLSSNANESKINKERSRFNSDFEFDEYFQEEYKKVKKGRITPKIFESLDVIDLDHPKYEGHSDTKVPLIIRSYKDLTNHG